MSVPSVPPLLARTPRPRRAAMSPTCAPGRARARRHHHVSRSATAQELPRAFHSRSGSLGSAPVNGRGVVIWSTGLKNRPNQDRFCRASEPTGLASASHGPNQANKRSCGASATRPGGRARAEPLHPLWLVLTNAEEIEQAEDDEHVGRSSHLAAASLESRRWRRCVRHSPGCRETQ